MPAAVQRTVLFLALSPDAFGQILEPSLVFKQRAHGFRAQITIATQHGDFCMQVNIGHQRRKPHPVGRPLFIVRPPDAVGTDIRRALVLALARDAVIERMGDEQIHAPHGQPVGVPLHVTARKLPRVVIFVAGTKAFVGIATTTHQAGGIGAALSHRGVHPGKTVLFGGQPAQNQILTGNGKIFFNLNIVALVRVAHQPNAVCCAPAGKAAVVDFTLASQNQLVVQFGVDVLLALEQRCQPGQITAHIRKQIGKAVGPREHSLDIAAQNTRFIGEKSDDCIAEIVFQFAVVGFMSQFNKTVDCRRV